MMNKNFAIVGTVIIASVPLAACGQKKPAIDMAAVNAGVVAVNSQLPIQLRTELTLTKASVVGNQVEFDYFSPFPSKAQLPPRVTGSMRGSMAQ